MKKIRSYDLIAIISQRSSFRAFKICALSSITYIIKFIGLSPIVLFVKTYINYFISFYFTITACCSGCRLRRWWMAVHKKEQECNTCNSFILAFFFSVSFSADFNCFAEWNFIHYINLKMSKQWMVFFWLKTISILLLRSRPQACSISGNNFFLKKIGLFMIIKWKIDGCIIIRTFALDSKCAQRQQ